MLNNCRSRYHRDNTLCRDCADARACLACRPAACYSQYEQNAQPCIQCPLAEYCRASTYCHKRFHSARHGEPQIVLAEIQSAVPEAEQDKYNILSEFAGVILSAGNNDPLNVAIIIARAAGCTLESIAQYLKMKKQSVAQRIEALNNLHMKNYLKNVHATKHEHNIIKEVLGSSSSRKKTSELGRVAETEDSGRKKSGGKTGGRKELKKKIKSYAFKNRKSRGQSA